MAIRDLTALRDALASGQVSSEDVTNVYLERIVRYDPSLSSYITVCAEEALVAARESDQAIARGRARKPLEGVPLGIKDLIDTRGVRTTSGSQLEGARVPTEDAAVWAKLRAAGAHLIGKNNLHEFAFGATNENPHYGACRNPWDTARISGGSSGGSAVAVAADLTPASIGTDTGGSIRIPAAFCGVIGLKPTYGRVSVRGITPLAYSLDHAGPITRSIRDAALLMDIIAGFDLEDDLSVHAPLRSFGARLGRGAKDVRIGVSRTFFFENVQREIALRAHELLERLAGEGAVIDEMDLDLSDIPDAQNVIITSEALYAHQQRLEVGGALYGADVRDRLMRGMSYSSVDYARAQRIRYALRARMRRVFEDVDLLLAPTVAFLPTPIGSGVVALPAGEEPVRNHLTRLTNPLNLAGIPALSVPCGRSSDGLPIGMQLIGPELQEDLVLQVGEVIERLYPLEAPDLNEFMGKRG